MSIPILTIRILDIRIPDEPDSKKLLLGGAKDLLKAHPEEIKKERVDVDQFSNKFIQYSGIQLGRYQGAPEWTAIGTESVKALRLWYTLFKNNNPHLLKNVVCINETYTPTFLKYQKKYVVQPLLLNDEVAKTLNGVNDKFLLHDRLEKYLYGNLQTFFQFIGFSYDKDTHFLKVYVLATKEYDKSFQVYHNQKKTGYGIRFKCNFRLPQTLRLGQATAIGYGSTQHE